MSYEKTDPATRDVRTVEHHAFLKARRDNIDDQDEWVNEVLAQNARVIDPENCTDEDLARGYGPNWREVTAVIQQAVSLTRDQAEKIASHALPEWRLDNLLEEVGTEVTGSDMWYLIGQAGDEALEPKYRKAEIYWETRYAYLAALLAAAVGDQISDDLRDRMTYIWNDR
ncbi:hypothetical protein ACFYPA_06335 [Streptomyces sp. NPDC005775]|uniref:hypothetical protein n=1 Tax=Streptomyces sp. NPDC005775 TaxID=3364729 RepID=UPI0036D17C81